MKKLLIIIIGILFLMNGNAQDTLDIEEKARLFYGHENEAFQKERRIFSQTMFDKYNYPPTPSQSDSFFYEFHKQQRHRLSKALKEKSDTNDLVSFIKERLNIWELMQGGTIPDSTFLILMDNYFQIDTNAAILFCVNHWAFRKSHEIDIVDFHDIPWIKNYPYVVYLFDHLSVAELGEVLLSENELIPDENKAFVDLCIKELMYTPFNRLLFKKYIETLMSSSNLKPRNDYFFQRVKRMEK